MTHEARAVVAGRKGVPASVETVLVPDPGPGEAPVRVRACAVCRTDPHHREGGIESVFPFLLGHAAAGVAGSVGEDVTDVAPGNCVALDPETSRIRRRTGPGTGRTDPHRQDSQEMDTWPLRTT